jgi:hypothetical protein
MFVKLCRYRVQPAMMDRFLSIQEQAARIYQKYDFEPATYYQSRRDPNAWLEVHRFADERACEEASRQMARDPHILALWKAFEETLDSKSPPHVEEFDERSWFRGEARSDFGKSNGAASTDARLGESHST